MPPVTGATLPANFFETIIPGLISPTAMAFAPDGRLFVCEQGGKLRVIKNDALLPDAFTTLTVDSSGERGLLGVAFAPDFATAANKYVYVYYTVSAAPIHNRVSRFTANGDVAFPGSELPILDLEDLSSVSHNGGAIHFGPDGKLYVAVGENAIGSNSQVLTNRLGKILRINPDGSIPADNPFYGTASGVNRSIWALGLRNPFTFGFQPGTGRMFINDVGAGTWEEINDGVAGSNYGWPTTEGPTNDPNFRSPLFAYGHGTGPATGCAIVGAAFYNPSVNQYPGQYFGQYFFADLCSGWIRQMNPANNAVSDFASGISNPVDLAVSPDGYLYYLSLGSSAVSKITYGCCEPANVPPTAVAVSPNSGTGSSQVFTLTYSDLNGYTDIAWAYVLFNSTLNSANTCYVAYYRPGNALYLVSDSGGAFLGPITPGTATTLQNSQCTMNGSGSSASGSAATMTLNVSLTFKPAFTGLKNIYMNDSDMGGLSSGYQIRGSWTGTAAPPNVAPTVDSVTPNSGTGTNQTFGLAYSDSNGYTDIAWTYVLFNSLLSSANTCYAVYYRPGNTLYLVDDAGSAFLGPITPGTATTLQNSQCTLNGSGSSAIGSANTMTLNVSLTFKPAFTGSKNIYMNDSDMGGLSSGYQIRGSWTGTSAPPNVTPTVDSVTPNSGTGTNQTFSLAYSDANGYTDIAWAYALFNSVLNSPNACYLAYYRPGNALYLVNDSGDAFLGPITPGPGATLQNSQCTLNGSGSSASGSANTMTLNVSLTFKPAFTGLKNIYMNDSDMGGSSSGYQIRGSWTGTSGPPNVAPTVDSVTPNFGTGTDQTFALAYSDANSYTDIAWAYVLINSVLNSPNTCYLAYYRPGNALYLVDDAGSAFLGPITPGTTATLQNSQCALNGSGSSVSGSANTMTLNVSLTFKPAFTGSKNIYMNDSDMGGLSSGYQIRGSWTIP